MVEWVKRFLKVKENNSVNITYINIIGLTIGCLQYGCNCWMKRAEPRLVLRQNIMIR